MNNKIVMNRSLGVLLCGLQWFPPPLWPKVCPDAGFLYCSGKCDHIWIRRDINVGDPMRLRRWCSSTFQRCRREPPAVTSSSYSQAVCEQARRARYSQYFSGERRVDGAAGERNGRLSSTRAAVASGLSVLAADDYIYVDATHAVQNWINGVTTNSGFIITPAGGGVNVAFDSKESTTTKHPATLEISLGNAGQGRRVRLEQWEPRDRPADRTTGAAGAAGPAGPQGSAAQPVPPRIRHAFDEFPFLRPMDKCSILPIMPASGTYAVMAYMTFYDNVDGLGRLPAL